MILWKKVAVSFAAMSMIVSPVAASAAPRALSVVDDQNELEGGSWIAIVLGLAIVAGGVWLAVDSDDDPVSP
ncbi:Putative secreted protein [Sphingopyxis fribergensis]|uniref:Putative secreted protein n=1 Tax=Sphingopyxis fribergensis TaxID=1515612 RepID=A0A0A7PAF1_9SPHN|nr:hypothetical protein [Sphingopyxis fribergensis]AJA07056.1 Putative secreted protein [Sphingopyxis fribergensis]